MGAGLDYPNCHQLTVPNARLPWLSTLRIGGCKLLGVHEQLRVPAAKVMGWLVKEMDAQLVQFLGCYPVAHCFYYYIIVYKTHVHNHTCDERMADMMPLRKVL